MSYLADLLEKDMLLYCVLPDSLSLRALAGVELLLDGRTLPIGIILAILIRGSGRNKTTPTNMMTTTTTNKDLPQEGDK